MKWPSRLKLVVIPPTDRWNRRGAYRPSVEGSFKQAMRRFDSEEARLIFSSVLEQVAQDTEDGNEEGFELC